MKSKLEKLSKWLSPKILTTVSGSFIIALFFTKSLTIAGATTLVISILTLLSIKSRASKFRLQMSVAIPEIIDHIISGVQSGLSLNESLNSLAIRGPQITQRYFEEHQARMNEGSNFFDSINILQREFGLRSADQLFESMLFAKTLGGAELVTLLRQLGDFTRQDLELRNEIGAKQGWIKNSAHLSAGAPWILLLLLSTQPNTSAAFSTPAGTVVLLLGILLTSVAYLWMGHLSQLPSPSRIFGEQ
jgi:tight adherence protein B